MVNLTKNEILELLNQGKINEVNHGVELKRNWDKKYGEDISAIANHRPFEGGFLIVGVEDAGHLFGHEEKWLKKTEEIISNQIGQFLAPSWAVKKIEGLTLDKGCCILIEIINPGDVVEWNGIAYKLTGTTSTAMSPDESLALTLELPGEDYSKSPWQGDINSELVIGYAKKLQLAKVPEFSGDISKLSAEDILKRLYIAGTNTSKILFGDSVFRVVHFDEKGDILDQKEKKGLAHIFQDDFIDEIQTWTRSRGTVVKGTSVSAQEEEPYPIKALREVIANAVAHSLYSRDDGDIVVEIHPKYLKISNNCLLEAKVFSKQWFSRSAHVRNKLLMRLLRAAKITDEQGTGKIRIFRQMMESGRREPIIGFEERGRIARWSVTLFNEEHNQKIQDLISRLSELFSDYEMQRLATALVLWSENSWPSILEKLDEYYKQIALSVVGHKNSPVIVLGDQLFLKRWASIILTGQQSRRFSEAEEIKIQNLLKAYAFASGREGNIATDEARKLIGLSTTPAESTQLSNLFRKWAEKNIIQLMKRGHWKFLTHEQNGLNVLMDLSTIEIEDQNS